MAKDDCAVAMCGRSALYGLALLVACHHATAEEALAEYLLREVESRGPAVVLNQEYSNHEEWTQLIRHIEQGSDAWLRVASLLYPSSDAGARQELEGAVGEALAARPESVFNVAYPAFDASQVCGAPDMNDDRYNTYPKALVGIDRRIAAVKNVRKKNALVTRNQCLDALRVARAELQARSDE